MSDRYIQRVEAVDVSMERATERTPDYNRYHVFVGDRLEGSFRSFKAAQAAFRSAVEQRGWKPQKRQIDPTEVLGRERAETDRAAYEDYWGTAHTFRRTGRPKRRQR